MKARLDKDERELLESYEAGELEPVDRQSAEIARYKEIARASLRKDRRVNIRISSRDLEEIRKRAVIEGLPYQTLSASVLHKFVSGRLREDTHGQQPPR